MVEKTDHDTLKRFYCGSKDLCAFKNEWANNSRCFATYPVRSSCPNVIRKDGKTWRNGSKENDELCRMGS